MIKKGLKFLIEKAIMVLWISVGFSVVLLFSSMFYGGMGGAGWMGFVYVGVACLSFVAIRLLRIAQEWIEIKPLEEI